MRRTDKAHETPGPADRRIYLFRPSYAVGNEDVANAFTRKTQGFTVRIADDGVAVKLRDIQNRKAVVNDFAIRFVR